MAHNFLAAIENHQKTIRQSAASPGARLISGAGRRLPADYAIQASAGIAGIFRLKGQSDSAWYYYELYHQYKDSRAAGMSQMHLSNLKARINFDELQSSYNRAQTALQKEEKLHAM